MDNKASKKTQQVDKLSKVTKRIQKARKNIKIAEKEAAEFKEIHKLLESTDEEIQDVAETELLPEEIKLLDCSVIPMGLPGVKVFHNELTFSLFNEQDCLLKNFLKNNDEILVFSHFKLIPSEEGFRRLISCHLIENLLPEEGKCSSISLYVLYLMSVHEEPSFVESCFHFLTHHKFSLQLEDLLPIFINFGAKSEDLFRFCEKSFLEKFPEKNGKAKRGSPAVKFPQHNLEMVGKILLQYISENLLVIDANIKPFIRGLVKITLDPKIRSNTLLPLYSTIFTTLCSKIRKHFTLEEILTCIQIKGHLLNQVEISQNILKPACKDLHDAYILSILSQILQSNLTPPQPPLKISHVKAALRRSYERNLTPLELYAVLQVINGSLPSLTATLKHSVEINSLVAYLEQKISKVEDSVDLIRLKLEIAKVGNSVTNNINNRFGVDEDLGKVTCSN